jgi:hypothetical protein
MRQFRSFGTVALAVWLVAIGLAATSAAQITYKTYSNARFEYSISYPNLLVPQGEATNGDGQKFRSRDGRAELIVYGGHNALEKTLRDIYDDEVSATAHPKRVVTYKVLRTDWFVVSGREGGKILSEDDAQGRYVQDLSL